MPDYNKQPHDIDYYATDGDNDIKPIDYDNLVANYKHYRRLFHDLAHTLNDRTREHHHHARDNDIIVCTANCATNVNVVVLTTDEYDRTSTIEYGPRDHEHDTRDSD